MRTYRSRPSGGFQGFFNGKHHLIAGFYPNDSDVWFNPRMGPFPDWVREHIPVRHHHKRMEYLKAALYQETYNA